MGRVAAEAPGDERMARVFYLGAPSRVQVPPGTPPGRAIRDTGGNTGNLLIGHALRRQLKAESFADRRNIGVDYIRENFDYVVVGASNFLYRNFDFTLWADFLEQVRLPCTIIGLGAQAPEYGCPVEVPAGTRKLIQIISERSTTLGVRGAWTASVLESMGIRNVRVIGCPAIFWNCEPELELKGLAAGRPLAVAVNGSAQGVEHACDPTAAQAVEAHLARLSFSRGYPYILQNAVAVAELAGGAPVQDPELVRRLMQLYGLEELAPDIFLDFIRRSTRLYFDVEAWRASMREFDFVVGTRFHGCLIGLLAGVPGFVFAHDARTLELCELLNLPHRSVRGAKGVEVEELYASLDRAKLQATYRSLYRNYLQFLEENRVEHVLPKPALSG